MAYDKFGLQINRGILTANGQGSGTTVIHTYQNLNDTLATIQSLGYFPDFFVEVNSSPNLPPQTIGENILVNDLLWIIGSDGVVIVLITDLEPVTLSSSAIVPNTITIGVPIDATDNNALAYHSGVLQAEFADATHNGIVSTVNQTFSGEKFFANLLAAEDGLTTPTLFATTEAFFGGGVIGISFFDNNVSTITWSGPWGATNPTSLINLTIINNKVLMSISGVTAIPATVSSPILGSPAIPLAYIPTTTKTFTFIATNNSVNVIGSGIISNAGIITLYSDLAASNFTNSGNAGFFDISFMYDITI